MSSVKRVNVTALGKGIRRSPAGTEKPTLKCGAVGFQSEDSVTQVMELLRSRTEGERPTRGRAVAGGGHLGPEAVLLKWRNREDPGKPPTRTFRGVQRTTLSNMATCPQRPSPQAGGHGRPAVSTPLDPGVARGRGREGILRVVSRRDRRALEPAVEAGIFQVLCLLTHRPGQGWGPRR